MTKRKPVKQDTQYLQGYYDYMHIGTNNAPKDKRKAEFYNKGWRAAQIANNRIINRRQRKLQEERK